MKRLAIVVVVIVMGVAAGLWFAHTRRPVRNRQTDLPNILLITLDTTRADHLSCYGYTRATSPRIDALAAEGMVYDRCIATSSWTLPAHASLLTGRFPTSHGAIYDPNGAVVLAGILPGEWANYRVSALGDRIETLATVLKRHGYVTGGVVGGPWLKKPFGLGQGFDDYDDDEITNVNGRLAEQINRRALPWIERMADRPFLLFLNYFDPHDPYLPPEEFRYRFLDTSKLIGGAKATPEQLLALYDAEIHYTDHFLGQLVDHLKDLGVYDDTWIIITADHGELFGEHDLRGHGLTLYEEEVHIPLIMKFPKRWAKQGRSPDLIRLVDVMPIILDRLEIPLPSRVQGTAFGQSRGWALAETYPLSVLSKRGHYRAFYRGNFKYIWNSRGGHMLFDLDADPREQNNLYALQLERAADMRTAMDALMKALPRPTQTTVVTHVDPNTLRILRSLGYVTGASSASRPTTTSTFPAARP